MLCEWCGEPVEPIELYATGQGMHRECAFRCIIGSLAHLEGKCDHYVKDSTAGDPPGMTKRQAAIMSWSYWHSLTIAQQNAILSRNRLHT